MLIKNYKLKAGNHTETIQGGYTLKSVPYTINVNI